MAGIYGNCFIFNPGGGWKRITPEDWNGWQKAFDEMPDFYEGWQLAFVEAVAVTQ
jgi:hypothetical protein